MSVKRYNHIELSAVDNNGNVDILYPKNKGVDVSLNTTTNKKGTNNTSVIPTTVSTVQDLVDNLGSGAFQTFTISNSANVTEPGSVADSRQIKSLSDQLSYILQHGVEAGGTVTNTVKDTVVTFLKSNWVRENNGTYTNTLEVGSSTSLLISDNFVYGLISKDGQSEPSNEEYDEMGYILDVAHDKDNYTIVATASQALTLDLTVVLKGNGGSNTASSSSSDTVVTFSNSSWVKTSDGEFENVKVLAQNVCDAIPDQFIYGLTTTNGSAPSQEAYDAFACIKDVCLDKGRYMVTVTSSKAAKEDINIVFKGAGAISTALNGATTTYANLNVTIDDDLWEECADDADYAYKQTCFNSNLTSTLNPVCSLAYGTDYTYNEYESAWAKIKCIRTNNGSISFYANEIPPMDFDVVVHSIATAGSNATQMEDVLSTLSQFSLQLDQMRTELLIMGTTIEIPSAGWNRDETEGSVYYDMFTNTISFNGMTTDFSPLIYLMSMSETGITTDEEQDNFELIRAVYTGNNSITFVAEEQPLVTLKVLVK